MSSDDQISAPLKSKEEMGHSVLIELHPNDESLKMSVGKEQLMREQKSDPTLSSYFSLVNQSVPDKGV